MITGIKRNIEFLRENLPEIFNAIHHNNEIWYRVYPPPPLESYFKNNVSAAEIGRIERVGKFVLYIHFPFCKNRCDYCIHHGVCNLDKIGSGAYVGCLIKELEHILKTGGKKEILSILMGGGTPSLIDPLDLRRLMDYLRKNFIFSDNAQISMEAAPADINHEMAEAIGKSGITRVCLGVQTFNERKLKLCNRRFQKNTHVYGAVKNLKKASVNNISIDLIYGLDQSESVEDFLNDNLDHILKLQLSPGSLDIYPLQNYKKFPSAVYKFPSGNVKIIRQIINDRLGKQEQGRE